MASNGFHFPVEDLSQAFSNFGVKPSSAKKTPGRVFRRRAHKPSPTTSPAPGKSAEEKLEEENKENQPTERDQELRREDETPEGGKSASSPGFAFPSASFASGVSSTPARSPQRDKTAPEPTDARKEEAGPVPFLPSWGGLFAAGTATPVPKAPKEKRPKQKTDTDNTPMTEAPEPQPDMTVELVLAAVTAARAAVWASVAAR
jgi:hypothetical protein